MVCEEEEEDAGDTGVYPSFAGSFIDRICSRVSVAISCWTCCLGTPGERCCANPEPPPECSSIQEFTGSDDAEAGGRDFVLSDSDPCKTLVSVGAKMFQLFKLKNCFDLEVEVTRCYDALIEVKEIAAAKLDDFKTVWRDHIRKPNQNLGKLTIQSYERVYCYTAQSNVCGEALCEVISTGSSRRWPMHTLDPMPAEVVVTGPTAAAGTVPVQVVLWSSLLLSLDLTILLESVVLGRWLLLGLSACDFAVLFRVVQASSVYLPPADQVIRLTLTGCTVVLVIAIPVLPVPAELLGLTMPQAMLLLLITLCILVILVILVILAETHWDTVAMSCSILYSQVLDLSTFTFVSVLRSALGVLRVSGARRKKRNVIFILLCAVSVGNTSPFPGGEIPVQIRGAKMADGTFVAQLRGSPNTGYCVLIQIGTPGNQEVEMCVLCSEN